MNSVCPSRRSATSSGWGSLTPSTISAASKTSSAVGQDARALGLEVGIGDRAALAGPALDEHLVAVLGELADADRRQRDAVFVRLDLGRNSNNHYALPPLLSRACVADGRAFII